jgi:hypothetical protein
MGLSYNHIERSVLVLTVLRFVLQELAPSTWPDKMFICSRDEGNISKFGSCHRENVLHLRYKDELNQ